MMGLYPKNYAFSMLIVLGICASLTFAKHTDDREDDVKNLNSLSKASALSSYVRKPFELGNAHGRNVLNIVDTTAKKWAVRFDRAHATGATYNHINVNPRISGVPDPHTPISSLTVGMAGEVGKVGKIFNKAGNMVFYASVFIDGIRVADAWANDEPEKARQKTVKIGAEWAGGYAGGTLGAKAGASIGASAGTILGPAGTVIGGFVGGIFGGIGGALYGNYYAGQIFD